MINKKLLLIDTGKVTEMYIRDLISPLNYDIVHAKNHENAREYLMHVNSIDVAIVSMELLEAEQLIDELLDKSVPTILLSDCEDQATREKLLKKDVIGFTTKADKGSLEKLVDILQKLEKNSTKKILIVDDSALFRQYMTGFLKRHRFIVLEASDGEEALKVLANNKDIKLVISDYDMPKINGLELVHKIREKLPSNKLPIIIVSAAGKNSVTTACLKEGANDYLHKPFEREEFLSRINLTLNNQENIDTLNEQKILLEDYQKTLDKTTVITRTNRNGVITYASEAMVNLSGYSKDELIGQAHSLLRHPDTKDTLYNDLWNTLNSGNIWTGELKNKKKNGDLFWLQTTITAELDINGRIIGFNAVSHDNTLKKELEYLTQNLESRVSEEISKNKQQASHMLQQSRLAQMGEMISMIAHQWRQPLASISAISGTLSLDVMMDNYKKEFFQERLEAISNLSQHLSSTINDFRSFFKEKKDYETTSLSEIVNTSLKIIGSTLESKGITIEKTTDDDIVLETYPNEIKQVLLNLLKNAEEAFDDNRTIDPKITIQGHIKDDMAYLSIQDNAGGVPPEIMEKIFDPYFTTKTKKDGTGLGLYMSKTIIEEHCGGKINIMNINNGVCFELLLPLKPYRTDKQ